jgi:hypothetical protein
MINKEDINHLIAAEQRIRTVLFPPSASFMEHFHSPGRRAASILCEEMKWLAFERPDFWRELQEGCRELSKYRDQQNEFFENMRDLVDLEIGAFEKLGIKEEDSLASIGWVYNALDIVEHGQDPTPEALANLQSRLAVATDLVCNASRGILRRAFDGVVSLKGLRIISGASVAGVNVAVAHFDFGVISWKSLSAGYFVMKADIDSLIKLLGGKKDS